MTNDSWQRIKTMLEAQGRMVGGVTRAATARTCRDCGAPVLAGLDGDVAAVTVRVDPAPLDAAGEALAVLGGRGTYSLRRSGRRFELDRRDPFHMRTPAGTSTYDVCAEHRCGSPPLPTTHSRLVTPEPPKETTCPF